MVGGLTRDLSHRSRQGFRLRYRTWLWAWCPRTSPRSYRRSTASPLRPRRGAAASRSPRRSSPRPTRRSSRCRPISLRATRKSSQPAAEAFIPRLGRPLFAPPKILYPYEITPAGKSGGLERDVDQFMDSTVWRRPRSSARAPWAACLCQTRVFIPCYRQAVASSHHRGQLSHT